MGLITLIASCVKDVPFSADESNSARPSQAISAVSGSGLSGGSGSILGGVISNRDAEFMKLQQEEEDYLIIR